MSIDTYQTHDGMTVVKLQSRCNKINHKINLYFTNRQDAAALLKALRKRVR